MIDPSEPGIRELMEAAVCNAQTRVILTKSMNENESGADFLESSVRFHQPKTMEDEVKRLQNLRSYLILDCDPELPFERLTALASRTFKTRMALVTLVDVDRQWFVSNRGLGNVRESHRKHAFCAHAITSDEDIMIVRDATQDPRFKNNPLVTGPASIRFYAGAPLISPEGYKLGTFCVVDTVPRPNGLDLNDKQNLREFSALAVQVLVTRRRKRERECEQNSQLISCIAHDLLTPLSGIELSLALLKDDAEFRNRLSTDETLGLQKAIECSGMVQDICRNIRSTFGDTNRSFEETHIRSQLHSFVVDQMVDRLYLVLDQIDKSVPVKIVVDADVPRQIISDSAKIFRCAMNYLVVACSRTKTGMISLRFATRTDDHSNRPVLFVICDDTAAPIDPESYPYLFKPVTSRIPVFTDGPGRSRRNKDRCSNLELALFSVASEMNSVGGEYGFHPRSEEHESLMDDPSHETPGSTFWFSLSYSVVEQKPQPMPTGSAQAISRKIATQFHEAVMEASEPVVPPRDVLPPVADSSRQEQVIEQVVASKPDVGSMERKRKALVIEDSAIVLKMLTRSLTKLGFEVTQAENGLEGLNELKSSLFDLTLCDFLMPVMDGLDCIQQYREWERTHRSWFTQRIIGISAHACKADIDKGIQLGMNGYKDKPVTLKDLEALIGTDEQQTVPKILDKIQEHEISSLNASIAFNYGDLDDEGEHPTCMDASERVQRATSSSLACLLLTPVATDAHDKRVQEAIREVGWQSACIHSDLEAWHMLKMRTWDVILADEAFSPLIEEFRQWESAHRGQSQSNVIAISELLVPGASDPTIKKPEFDDVIGKPLGIKALQNLLLGKTGEIEWKNRVGYTL